jgi:hypothetical protein
MDTLSRVPVMLGREGLAELGGRIVEFLGQES